jgi:hypothetical protein
MGEVFVESATILAEDGRAFVPRVCGGPFDHMWAGWIEFTPLDGGEVIRTPRETTQPNRTDLEYWALGITPTYLEGALARALQPRVAPRPAVPVASAFDEPAPRMASPAAWPVPPSASPESTAGSVLDPFAVFQKGEPFLRRQLAALAPWRLVDIIRDYELGPTDPAMLDEAPQQVLIDVIVDEVRERAVRQTR